MARTWRSKTWEFFALNSSAIADKPACHLFDDLIPAQGVELLNFGLSYPRFSKVFALFFHLATRFCKSLQSFHALMRFEMNA